VNGFYYRRSAFIAEAKFLEMNSTASDHLP